MMISNSTFANWLLVMDTPDGAEEATETRNAWHVISKDFLTGTPNDLLATLENTPMAAILIPVMREGSIELYLAHHICRLTPSSVPKCQVCVNFHSQGVCNANDACRFKASHAPLPTGVHQAYNTWQKDSRATA